MIDRRCAKRPPTSAALLVLIIGASVASCRAPNPDDEVVRGDRFFQSKQYPEAIIEYRQAVTKDPKSGTLRLKLADAYMQRNSLAAAAKEYKNAAELLPDDADVQLKWLGMLQLGKMYDDVWEGTEKLLRKDPQNAAAHVLHAQANAGRKEFDVASSELQQAILNDPPNRDNYYVNLGAVRLLADKPEEADAAFAAGARADPNSVMAHLVLAGNEWAHGRLTGAEQSFARVLAIEPDNRTANRAMAALYLRSHRVAEAERYLKAVAEATPTTPVRLMLSDYYILTNRPDDARRILTVTAESKEGYAEARSRLATIEYEAGRQAEGRRLIDETLRNDSTNARALLTKANFLVSERKADEALPLVKAALIIDPRSVSGHWMLGSIYLSKRDTSGAISAFSEVVKLSPQSAEAQLQLARLHLANGAPALAGDFAAQVVRASPTDARARLMLVRAFIGKGEVAWADTEVRALLLEQPTLAEAHTLAGSIALLKNDRLAAHRAFQRSLELEPAGLEPFENLVEQALAVGDAASARALVEQRLARQSNDPVLWRLAGKTYLQIGAAEKAESALRRAIDLEVSNPEAYAMLAQVYLSRREPLRALAQFEQMLERDPKSVPALTMMGMALEMESRPAEAEKRYEQALEINPHAVVAANNLAWLYLTRGVNLDMALQLAQAAARDAPEQPVVNDTLGWLYYQKNLMSLAIPPLELSVGQAPRNPVFRYHLGLAYARLGYSDRARKMLSEAIALSPAFDGADAARTALASLTR